MTYASMALRPLALSPRRAGLRGRGGASLEAARRRAPRYALRSLIPAALIVAAVTTAAVLHPPYRGSQVLMGLTAGLLVLGLHAPLWGLLAVLLTELSIANNPMPGMGISVRYVVVGAALATAIPALRAGAASDPRLRRVLLPAVALVVMAVAVNLLTEEMGYTVKYARFQAVQLAVLLLTSCAIRDRRDLLRFAVAALGMIVLSAAAAIWQHFDRFSALYGAGTFKDLVDFHGRAIGLSTSPVQVSKHLTFALVPVVGVLVSGPLRMDRSRALLLAALTVLGGALYFTYTRSALLGSGIGVLVVGALLPGARRVILLVAVLTPVLLFAAGIFGDRYYRDADTDRSAAGHEALWAVGLAIAMDRGLVGIGHGHFEEVSTDYSSLVQDELGGSTEAELGAKVIGQMRPHNDFLSVWTSWGILALVAYLAVLATTLANFRAAARSRDALLRGLAIGGAAALTAYAVDSAFHNSLDSSVLLWVYAGLSAAMARLHLTGPVPAPAAGSGIKSPGRAPVAVRRRHSWRTT